MTTPTPSKTPATPPTFEALIGGLIAAVLALLVAFNVNLTADQVAAVMGVTTAVVTVGMFLWTHRRTVEFTKRGQVYRGPANEGTTGERVRTLGTIPDLRDSADRKADAAYHPREG